MHTKQSRLVRARVPDGNTCYRLLYKRLFFDGSRPVGAPGTQGADGALQNLCLPKPCSVKCGEAVASTMVLPFEEEQLSTLTNSQKTLPSKDTESHIQTTVGAFVMHADRPR